ncbi:stalk domain-containing protein [Paenibacillus sp. IITD108]|uniref:stalk domain-containing protein n=1 Tax=Paenibacillus sp. IITD108 TaxID=3116649 RepID=UPI002F3F366D
MKRIKLSKQILSISMMLLFLSMVTYVPPSVYAAEKASANANQIVVFEDPVLEKNVRMSLNKLEGKLTALDLSKITKLSTGFRITSLKGLEYAINLTEVTISCSNLKDMSPISSLKKIKSLTMNYCEIQDLTPIADLTNLEYLSLEGNFISDLTPLKNLSLLEMLILKNNNISDLSPIHSLPSLKILFVDDNFIESLEGNWNQSNLYGLYLNGNLVKDLSPVTASDSLKSLSFAYTQVTDLSSIQAMSLEAIQFDHTDVSDLTVLENMSSLKYIYLYKNPLTEESRAFLERFKERPETEVYESRYSGTLAIPKVFIDGKVHMFNTLHPVIYQDSTMLPLREVFQLFGADIKWDGKARTVTATNGDNKIVLTINSKTAQINNREVSLVAEPIIQQGRTLVPFRFVAEAFGYDVKWNDKNRWVMINTSK